jgi:hypothetical protein
MIHTEYKLIVKADIMESAGYSVKAVHYGVGDTLTLNEATFERLQAGETIESLTQEGFIHFDKYNFENEVTYTAININTGIRKLGQRKNK